MSPHILQLLDAKGSDMTFHDEIDARYQIAKQRTEHFEQDPQWYVAYAELAFLKNKVSEIEVTLKMINAGFSAYYNHPIPQDDTSMKRVLHDVFVAMLKAKEIK